jgi:DNA-binding winged helix-turn-helix (wHTH) protein
VHVHRAGAAVVVVAPDLGQQLLTEVWGYDYYGGTRTVDVHVRRLRAKLGADHENLISTVRNVGYRLTLVRHPEEELTEA